MTKEEFVAQLDRAGATLSGLPVTTAMVQWLAEALRKGDPPWWTATLKAWEKRKFVAWTEAWGLFLTAVHFEVLSDAANPLVPYFPSCEGTDEGDPSGALAEFLKNPPPSFYENLKLGHRRVYVEARAGMWIWPALLFFQRRNLPFYLVEVNAGAGLNLAADVVAPQKQFNSGLVEARIGLDQESLELENMAHRRWLTAAIMPDQVPLIQPLDNAMEEVLERRRRNENFIQLVEMKPELAAKFIAKNVPADDEDVGLMLFNMGATARMTDKEYEAYANGISQMMLPWGNRALWIEFESVRGELFSMTYQLRVHRLVGGQLGQHVMASFDFGASKTVFNGEESAKFLA